MSNLDSNNPNDITLGLSGGRDRIFRNPSGRTARIVPELPTGKSPGISSDLVSEYVPVIPESASIESKNYIQAPEKDFCWAHVTGSFRRERSIEGLLLGVMIGDAIGLGRSGLSRRSALRMLGRGPLRYCVIPGVGLVSSDSHRMLMTLQAILRSRSQLELFRRNFAMRLRFYLFSMPVLAGKATWIAAIRLCLGVSPDQSGINSDDNSPLINALAIATVMQGTGHSVERWVAVSSEVTHIKPEVVESSVLVARATYLAITTNPDEFSASSLLDRLILITEDAMLSAWLRDLRVGLDENLGAYAMASRLGWGGCVPSAAGPTAIMALYCWFRHHDRYEAAVEKAVLLGGDTITLGALTGGLAGIHLGAKKIPERWVSRLWSWPNGRQWMETLTNRFTDWPHGSEDLHAAPALPTRPILQLARSATFAICLAIGSAIRIPWKLSKWILG